MTPERVGETCDRLDKSLRGSESSRWLEAAEQEPVVDDLDIDNDTEDD